MEIQILMITYTIIIRGKIQHLNLYTEHAKCAKPLCLRLCEQEQVFTQEPVKSQDQASRSTCNPETKVF